MGRRVRHVVMALMLMWCIVSLVHTFVSHHEPCPICGQPMERIAVMHSLTIDRSSWRAHDVYRCDGCDYEVVMPCIRSVTGGRDNQPLRYAPHRQ